MASSLSYFSVYWCRTAPLRNMKRENGIRQEGLIANGNHNKFLFISGQKMDKSEAAPHMLSSVSWRDASSGF